MTHCRNAAAAGAADTAQNFHQLPFAPLPFSSVLPTLWKKAGPHLHTVGAHRIHPKAPVPAPLKAPMHAKAYLYSVRIPVHPRSPLPEKIHLPDAPKTTVVPSQTAFPTTYQVRHGGAHLRMTQEEIRYLPSRYGYRPQKKLIHLSF